MTEKMEVKKVRCTHTQIGRYTRTQNGGKTHACTERGRINSRNQWPKLEVLALGRLRQEDSQIKVNMGFEVRACKSKGPKAGLDHIIADSCLERDHLEEPRVVTKLLGTMFSRRLSPSEVPRPKV